MGKQRRLKNLRGRSPSLLRYLNFTVYGKTARNLLSRPPHRGRSELGQASGSEEVWGERGAKKG
jgi:hypothetical protein